LGTGGPREQVLKSLFAIAAIIALTTTGAYAACKHDQIPWRFGQTMASVWVTDDKSVCTSKSNQPQYIEKIEIESKPKQGIAGMSGPDAVAYKPKPGFHGSDIFTYAVTSNRSYPRGAGLVARITVFVTVQ
jgi:hypothetical protein